jgi:hypothetical protein
MPPEPERHGDHRARHELKLIIGAGASADNPHGQASRALLRYARPVIDLVVRRESARQATTAKLQSVPISGDRETSRGWSVADFGLRDRVVFRRVTRVVAAGRSSNLLWEPAKRC